MQTHPHCWAEHLLAIVGALHKGELSLTEEPKRLGTLCQACLSTPILMTSDKTAPDWLATKETPRPVRPRPGRPAGPRTLMGSRRGRDFPHPIRAITGCYLPPSPLSPGFLEALSQALWDVALTVPWVSVGRWFLSTQHPLPPPQVGPGRSSRKFGLPAGLQGSSLQAHLGRASMPKHGQV